MRDPDGFSFVDVGSASHCRENACNGMRRSNETLSLGFKRFAGRGSCYIIEWCPLWVAIAGWQFGTFKCRSRDRRIGWTGKEQFRQLNLIANNLLTAFLTLSVEPWRRWCGRRSRSRIFTRATMDLFLQRCPLPHGKVVHWITGLS